MTNVKLSGEILDYVRRADDLLNGMAYDVLADVRIRERECFALLTAVECGLIESLSDTGLLALLRGIVNIRRVFELAAWIAPSNDLPSWVTADKVSKIYNASEDSHVKIINAAAAAAPVGVDGLTHRRAVVRYMRRALAEAIADAGMWAERFEQANR